ncbi:acyltransferase family protein [Bradyrhizobium sp.]|uniref:acyltransferase family protein n=1 Tax=Bradyrhizobium sp. TaxID=376 RepID=UPI003C75AB8A
MLERSYGEGSPVLPTGRPGHENDTSYRADIDGLRAVSILLVVGYHAQPWLVPGGFIGVDIFFVISGFLITRIILTQARAGAFSSLEFYARRIRRIFPALIVVLAVTYLIGWFVLLPDGFALLGRSTAAGVAFVSNLFQLRQTGYFAPDAAENPLLHLWSLGIEEQFYIFWPPLLMLMFGSKHRRVWMGAIAVASFGVSLMIFLGYKEWSFYSPISRAWELLAGGIVANRLVDRPQGETRRFPHSDNFKAAIGIAAIAGAAIMLNKDSLFPGAYALLPVLGAVLIIIAPNSAVNRILLSSRPMVLIGLVSYPLYLWHWPLLSYLAILRNGVPNAVEIWAAVVVAVVLSWLTFRFVEIPLRRNPNAVPRLSFALLTVGVAGLATAAGAGFGFRFPADIRDIAMLSPQNNAGFRDKCFLEAPGARLDANCIEPGNKPLLFLWGDSTAAALYPGLKKAEETIPFRLARFAAPGCAPILADVKCAGVNDLMFGFVKSSHPEIVLLHAMWDRTHDLEKLGETIRQLKALHIPRIVILGPVPLWKRTLPHSLVNTYRFRHVIADRIASGVTGAGSDEQMRAFSQAAGVEYISAWRALCDGEGCLTRVGPTADDVVTTDIVHLSDAGSKFLIEAIEGSLFHPQ